MTGRRLEPQQRRQQLLDVGAAMFAEKPYEDVFVEDIAARAGVSRASLYHYFPSKRAFYVAIFRRASNQLLGRANPDPDLPLAEQLATGLEAHIQYFADHPFEAIAINRGALSDDPSIQAIITDELNIIARRLIDKLVAEGHPRGVTEIAIEGWLAFVRAACVKWVQSPEITRAELAEMCLRAFDCLGYLNTPHTWPKELPDKLRLHGASSGASELTEAITPAAERWNRILGSFSWKATAGNIIAKVQRGRDTLHQIKTRTAH